MSLNKHSFKGQHERNQQFGNRSRKVTNDSARGGYYGRPNVADKVGNWRDPDAKIEEAWDSASYGRPSGKGRFDDRYSDDW